jgi:hypothetical protein
MQSGQVITFSQFTSSILRWIEDSCRPSVNDKTLIIKDKTNPEFFLFRILMILFVELLQVLNLDLSFTIMIFVFFFVFFFCTFLYLTLAFFLCITLIRCSFFLEFIFSRIKDVSKNSPI